NQIELTPRGGEARPVTYAIPLSKNNNTWASNRSSPVTILTPIHDCYADDYGIFYDEQHPCIIYDCGIDQQALCVGQIALLNGKPHCRKLKKIKLNRLQRQTPGYNVLQQTGKFSFIGIPIMYQLTSSGKLLTIDGFAAETKKNEFPIGMLTTMGLDGHQIGRASCGKEWRSRWAAEHVERTEE